MLKKRVLICDDDEEVTKNFRENHKDEFDIVEPINKIEDLNRVLSDANPPPELVVLDLYWPNETYLRQKSSVDPLIKEKNDTFIRMAEEIRSLDRQYHDALGLRELDRIARKFPKLPVLLYTRTGSYTLDDSDMQKAYKLDAGFLPKKRTRSFEREMMRLAIERKERQLSGTDQVEKAIATWTMRDILYRLTPAQLWKMGTALVLLVGGAFALGMKVCSAIASSGVAGSS